MLEVALQLILGHFQKAAEIPAWVPILALVALLG
jgi:hypothetical protein